MTGSHRFWGMLATLVLLAVGAGGAAGQGPALGVGQGRPVAVVNGAAVQLADVDAIIKSRGPTALPITDVQRRQMRLEVLSMLIDDLLLQQFLTQNTPPIAPAEVNKKIAELEQGLKLQKPPKTLKDFFAETGQNEAQVRNNVQNMLRWVGWVKERVNDADVKKYFEANRDFFDQVQVRASHIVRRLAPNTPPAERELTLAQMTELRKQILAGQISFEDAAKKYSQCESAPRGGDINFFPRKWAVDERFAEAAFALKIGEMSEVVQTEYGVHLIKVTDRGQLQPPKAPGQLPVKVPAGQETKADFEKIKDEVRELYVEEIRQRVLAEQRRTAKIDVNLP